jgi:hypothetical protein
MGAAMRGHKFTGVKWVLERLSLKH